MSNSPMTRKDAIDAFYFSHYDIQTGELSESMQNYWDAVVAAGAENFDCNQLASAMMDGLTPAEAAKEFNAEYQDRIVIDYDPLDRDYSMNY